MSKAVLGLELSSKQIRYAFLTKEGRTFSLLRQGKASLQGLISIGQPASLTQAIREIISKENISPSAICLTISAENLFINLTRLPTLPEAELHEVIADEIRKVPKFFGREFDYIYSGYKIDSQRQRVLFCAVDKSSLDIAMQAARNTGIRLECLETAPLNLLELLYPKTARDKTEALVFLDNNATYVIIFGQSDCRLFFKMSTGSTDLGSSKGINNSVFSSWVEEIKRVFRSYQREMGGREGGSRDIDKIWLVWDNEILPELYEFAARELGPELAIPRPDTFGFTLQNKKAGFNPIHMIALAGPLLLLKGQKRRFNFKHFLRGLKLKEVIRKTVLAVAVYLCVSAVLLGGVTLNYTLETRRLGEREQGAASRILSLEKETADLRKERDEYSAAKERLLDQATFVKMLNRLSWSEILGNIGLALPDNISLSSFAVPENGEVQLEGATVSIESVAELIRRISNCPFLYDVKFDFLRERRINQKEVTRLDKIIEFGIISRLKPDTDGKKDR
ncbi:MAG: PilN domain-containing protein [Candidatus Omnitrophica bacterium]|nr:PilN domain-containing protein [Candidatus Omnitrophota bacterium]